MKKIKIEMDSEQLSLYQLIIQIILCLYERNQSYKSFEKEVYIAFPLAFLKLFLNFY